MTNKPWKHYRDNPTDWMMEQKVLVLRTSDRNRQSYRGFQWPESGPVEAPDWDHTPKCGGGLHGALWGEGDGTLLSWFSDVTWQVVEVDADTVVDLKGKVKFPRGNVVYSGDRKGATEYILAHPDGMGRVIIGAEITVGDNGTALAGYNGTAISGNNGTSQAGNYGTATAGHRGKATVGNKGTATVGDHGTAIAGSKGTATAGNHGTAQAGHGGNVTVGDRGSATVGDFSIATAGYYGVITAGDHGSATAMDHGWATAMDWGHATVGNYGSATAGFGGTAWAGYGGKAQAGHQGIAQVGNYGTAIAGQRGEAIAGDYGTARVGEYGVAQAGFQGHIHIEWYDTKTKKYHLITGDIGKNNLLPNTPYRLDKDGTFILAGGSFP